MSEPAPPEPPAAPKNVWARPRLPFQPPTLEKQFNAAATWFYAALALVLAALSLYMALVEHRALMSAYVIAPAIGAAWFALRVFMLIAPKG